jgi:hypothetical protein
MMMVVMVMRVVAVVAVMVVMRRVRQRDVCKQNQCDCEADKFTHELNPLTLMNGYATGWTCRPAGGSRIAGDARECAFTCVLQRVRPQPPRAP